jgi:hypothetical protein
MIAPKADAASVAGICAGGIVGVAYIVGFATTPQSACGNTGCDTSYGLGVVLMFFPVFGVALAGVALGRLLGSRVTRQPPP